MIRTTTGWTYADAYGIVPEGLFDKNFVTHPGAWFREVEGWSCGEPEGLYNQFRRFWLCMPAASRIPEDVIMGAEINIAHFGRFLIVDVIDNRLEERSDPWDRYVNNVIVKARVL